MGTSSDEVLGELVLSHAARCLPTADAGQKESHAELLELCRAAAAQNQWLEEQIQPWRRCLPQLERHMADAESRVDDMHSPLAALRLVIEIESSEINEVFRSIVTAADSEFVRRINVFGDTERRHLSFIGQSIVRLEPSLAEAGRALAKRAAQAGLLIGPV